MQTDDSQTPTTSGTAHDPSAPLAVTAEASSSGGAAWDRPQVVVHPALRRPAPALWPPPSCSPRAPWLPRLRHVSSSWASAPSSRRGGPAPIAILPLPHL